MACQCSTSLFYCPVTILLQHSSAINTGNLPVNAYLPTHYRIPRSLTTCIVNKSSHYSPLSAVRFIMPEVWFSMLIPRNVTKRSLMCCNLRPPSPLSGHSPATASATDTLRHADDGTAQQEAAARAKNQPRSDDAQRKI